MQEGALWNITWELCGPMPFSVAGCAAISLPIPRSEVPETTLYGFASAVFSITPLLEVGGIMDSFI
jgi:hypothetical protein